MLRLWNLSVLLQYNSSLFENNRQHLCYLRNIHATILRVCRQGYCCSSFSFVFPVEVFSHVECLFWYYLLVFLMQPLSNNSLVITIIICSVWSDPSTTFWGGFHYHAIKNKKNETIQWIKLRIKGRKKETRANVLPNSQLSAVLCTWDIWRNFLPRFVEFCIKTTTTTTYFT